MGIKKTLTPIYKQLDGKRVQTGHKLNGTFIPLGSPLVLFVRKAMEKSQIKNTAKDNFTKQFNLKKKKK
jgi:hypothetical protein